MTDQLMLPGFPDPPIATVGLFIAAFPTREAVERAGRIADLLGFALRLSRARVHSERLHVTMQHVGYYAGLPTVAAGLTEFVLSEFCAAPFEFVFDEVVGGNRSVLLRGGGMADALMVQRRLRERLARAGLAHVMRQHSAPHMTLRYEGGVAGSCRIEPIRWRARSLVLVRSWLGQGRHERLAECILRG